MTDVGAPPEAPVVLLVDDRPDNLLALESLLAGLPCRTVRADSGEAALRTLLREEQVAVVLLDVQMPGLDGYETARAIKARERTSRVPIIFLSAIDREVEHQLRGYGVGAVDFLPKPLQPEFLLAKVAVFLDLHAQRTTIAAQADELQRRLAELEAAQEHLDRLASELERSNADLERFGLQLSHELREPLQLASALLVLLADRHGPALGPDGAELVEEAVGALGDMAGQVSRLLERARVEARGGEPRPVDLDVVLADVRRRAATRLAAADVELTADPLPVVRGDRDELEQVLVAVVGAALGRADAATASIHVGVTKEDGCWVLAFPDDGPPPAADGVLRQLSLLGRPGAEPGGLALARRLVERHGGSMSAAAAPGRGCTVRVALPVLP